TSSCANSPYLRCWYTPLPLRMSTARCRAQRCRYGSSSPGRGGTFPSAMRSNSFSANSCAPSSASAPAPCGAQRFCITRSTSRCTEAASSSRRRSGFPVAGEARRSAAISLGNLTARAAIVARGGPDRQTARMTANGLVQRTGRNRSSGVWEAIRTAAVVRASAPSAVAGVFRWPALAGSGGAVAGFPRLAVGIGFAGESPAPARVERRRRAAAEAVGEPGARLTWIPCVLRIAAQRGIIERRDLGDRHAGRLGVADRANQNRPGARLELEIRTNLEFEARGTFWPRTSVAAYRLNHCVLQIEGEILRGLQPQVDQTTRTK